jgi:hypothetical protein
MGTVDVHLCPETGICTIIKEGGGKVDLMPGEAQAIREAAGDAERIRDVVAECDADFAAGLNGGEVAEIASEVK